MQEVTIILSSNPWVAEQEPVNMKRLEPWKQSAIVLSCAQRMAETDLGRGVPLPF